MKLVAVVLAALAISSITISASAQQPMPAPQYNQRQYSPQQRPPQYRAPNARPQGFPRQGAAPMPNYRGGYRGGQNYGGTTGYIPGECLPYYDRYQGSVTLCSQGAYNGPGYGYPGPSYGYGPRYGYGYRRPVIIGGPMIGIGIGFGHGHHQSGLKVEIGKMPDKALRAAAEIAEVRINGRNYGMAGKFIELPPDDYDLEIVLQDGSGRMYSSPLHIEEGRTTSVVPFFKVPSPGEAQPVQPVRPIPQGRPLQPRPPAPTPTPTEQ